MGLQRVGIALALIGLWGIGVPANAQQVAPGMAGMAHDSATMAEMGTIHELLFQHEQIIRTVTNLPDGIRTTTESDDSRVAELLKKHVLDMDQRVRRGDDPGLPDESPALRSIYRNAAKITTAIETTPRGVVVTQTSSDAAVVAALQEHAAEVSDLVEGGMAALHSAMQRRMSEQMPSEHMPMGAPADHGGHVTHPTGDSAFSALQTRGHEAMGVDQYTSTHLFDALPDGGRIELQRDTDDPDGIAEIRGHLQEIVRAFASGDFSTPAFVHAQPVPGTAVMAAKRDVIRYSYRDLPRGGEVRIVTSDPEALAAIREFMAFQRQDHRAGGTDSTGMEHGGMYHDGTNNGATDHGGTAGHPAGGPGAMEHGPGGHGATGPGHAPRDAMHGR
jgi:hypothetical protein